MPQTDLVVKILLMCFIVCITFTYPLSINPCNVTLENYTINKIFPKKGAKRDTAKNISRVIICLSAVALSIELFDVLDKFLGLVGALFCAPLAFILPTMCHLKLVAKTNEEKIRDIAIVAFALVIMVFSIQLIISTW